MSCQDNQPKNSNGISILDFLDSGSYQIYNRHVARFCESVNAAIMLAELINRYKYHRDRNELTDSSFKFGEGWFYLTAEKAEERTCLTEKEQRPGIDKLVELGLIEKRTIGLPGKRHFRIIEENISASFSSKKDSSLDKKPKCFGQKANLDSTKGQSCHIYKNPKEDLYEEPQLQQQEAVAAVHKSIDQNKEAAKAMKIFLENRFVTPEWKIPIHVYEYLINEFNSAYVSDQLTHMVVSHENAMRDGITKNKVKTPESWLNLACYQNWGMSLNEKKEWNLKKRK